MTPDSHLQQKLLHLRTCNERDSLLRIAICEFVIRLNINDIEVDTLIEGYLRSASTWVVSEQSTPISISLGDNR